MIKLILVNGIIILILIISCNIYIDNNLEKHINIDKPALAQKSSSANKEFFTDKKEIFEVKKIQKEDVKNFQPAELYIEDESGHTIKVNIQPNGEEIIPGENITPESIENANVSEKEKEQMVDDMLYYQSLQKDETPSMNEEELIDLVMQDLEKLQWQNQ